MRQYLCMFDICKDVVSSVPWRVQCKDETPNQALKKTLNVVSYRTLTGAIPTWNPKPIPKIKNPKCGL